MVTFSMRTASLGQYHELVCNISGAEMLFPNVSYRWTKMNDTGTVLLVGTGSNTLFFSSLNLSDAGSFTCEVIITSNLLIESIIEANTTILMLPSKLISL